MILPQVAKLLGFLLQVYELLSECFVRCRVLLSEFCARFGGCCCRVPVQGSAAGCCGLRAGAAAGCTCDDDPALEKAFECCPRIPFAIWSLCWRNSIYSLLVYSRVVAFSTSVESSTAFPPLCILKLLATLY